MECETDIIFCHFGPFYVLLLQKKQKNQNFEKNKKIKLRDIIILRLCTTNDNHMMYGY